jgi:hypothetical protein
MKEDMFKQSGSKLYKPKIIAEEIVFVGKDIPEEDMINRIRLFKLEYKDYFDTVKRGIKNLFCSHFRFLFDFLSNFEFLSFKLSLEV